jgi:release factor glutamine methyltransferase
MEILKLINNGSKKLKNNNIYTHMLDSEILLSEVLKKTREELLINLNEKVGQNKIKEFHSLIKRRSSKEPIAYILNHKEFWSRSFLVNNNTLIPRPETELMVEKIIEVFKKNSAFILDIGTGSGCILLSILSELKNSKGIGIDKSSKAIQIACKNSKKLKLTQRAKFYTRPLNEFYNNKFDLIVSNPPYIMRKEVKNLSDDIKKFEPKLALDGGNDGLDVIKKVIYKSKDILKIKGMLALEIGNEQFKKVSKILKKNKFKTRYLVRDFRENIRCIMSTLEK